MASLSLNNKKETTSVRECEFSINTQWDGEPIDHAPIRVSLHSADIGIEIRIEAPFFNNPGSPPGMETGQPYAGLWDYEVVEAFFLASQSKKYLEVELNPHGAHLVLMLNGCRNCVKDRLPLDFKSTIQEGVWSGIAVIPIAYFPPEVDRFNAYAIHGSRDTRTYEALYPVPKGKFVSPDFHRLEYFQPHKVQELLEDRQEKMTQYWT